MGSAVTASVDVAQLVIRARFEEGHRYLLARRTMDGKWEFVGGKREDGETIRAAARRELDEELASVAPADAEIRDVGDAYPSAFGPEYMLTPILLELPPSVARGIGEADLSREHDALTWFSLPEFDEYETAGQFPALRELGLTGEDGPD